jgi:hypothetical protein
MGPWFPTLATKRKTRRGWGTRRPGSGNKVGLQAHRFVGLRADKQDGRLPLSKKAGSQVGVKP